MKQKKNILDKNYNPNKPWTSVNKNICRYYVII